MRIISSLMLMLLLAACNLTGTPATEEITLGVTLAASHTPAPTATSTTAPTTAAIEQNGCTIPGGWVAYTVQSGDTLFSIARRANSSVDALVETNCLESANVLNTGQTLYLPQAISTSSSTSSSTSDSDNLVYWLGSDNLINGDSIQVGCETYLTPFESDVEKSSDAATNIRETLNILFNLNEHSTYRNHWNDFDLSVGNVVIDNGLATIRIDGDDFLLGGTCSDPEIIAQLLLIVFSESQVETAWITVGGNNLKQISDMSGQSGENAVFTRDRSYLSNN